MVACCSLGVATERKSDGKSSQRFTLNCIQKACWTLVLSDSYRMSFVVCYAVLNERYADR